MFKEIEAIDDYWGPTFRSIYEGDGQQTLMENLEARIKSHDKEIERMCSQYYQVQLLITALDYELPHIGLFLLFGNIFHNRAS